MGIAALVCGIISVLCAFSGPGTVIGIVLGIVAIILAVIAKKDPAQSAAATAGLVLGIIGTIFCGILFIACVACAAVVGSAAANSQELQEAANELRDALNNL
ncbi:MAG: hypothetical protein LBJ31_07645 [Treponema sp.]|jgi:hypothetical protein|nr:hypothetical protein [Treponema sp.]